MQLRGEAESDDEYQQQKYRQRKVHLLPFLDFYLKGHNLVFTGFIHKKNPFRTTDDLPRKCTQSSELAVLAEITKKNNSPRKRLNIVREEKLSSLWCTPILQCM